MNEKRKIGIWGFGVVGKSILAYFSSSNTTCQIMDKKELTEQEDALLASYNATYIPETQKLDFFTHNDLIIPSPGIDISPYQFVHHKFISELDIFFENWKKPIIAVTGTVGKTSIVHLASSILRNFKISVA